MHPSRSIKGTHSRSLKNKHVVLGVCSSIAAVKTVELARELIRNGAEVTATMSDHAQEIIHPNALQFATGKEALTGLTGKVEHVSLFGEKGDADLFLVAPCSANLIGKIAHGIADCVLSTMALTALGSNKKVVLVPAMHSSMWNNPLVQENLEKLKSLNVDVVAPLKEEEVHKFPRIETIILYTERCLSEQKLKGKKLLIVSGKTTEPVDGVRVLTNRASGKTGVELAKEAFRQGAAVTLIHNKKTGIPGIAEKTVFSLNEFYDTTLAVLEQNFDWVLLPAALGDFIVSAENKKLDSNTIHQICLQPNKKLLSIIKQSFPKQKIVAFKATVGKTRGELLEIAKEKCTHDAIELVVANDITEQGMGTEHNAVWIVSAHQQEFVSGAKAEIARAIIAKITGD